MPPTKPPPIKGKTFLLGMFLTLGVIVGLVFWIGMSGGSQHVPRSRPGVGFKAEDTGAGPAPAADDPAAAAFGDGGAIAKTISDRRVRAELRKRILAGWAAGGDPEVAAAAKQGRFLPAPVGDGGGNMDPSYIQEVVREQFFPMAKKCYEELLTRKDAGGRFEMSFTIVADEKLGGLVEDVEADHGDSGLADEKMATCMRESMSTLAFRPPAHGGTVTVVYPILFSPGDEPPDE